MMKIAVRTYPESIYPVEKWIYRYENLDGSNPGKWMNGGTSLDEVKTEVSKLYAESEYTLTVENDR
jgi:hypothetical protein